MSHLQFISRLKTKLSLPASRQGIHPPWRNINYKKSINDIKGSINYRPAAVLILLFLKGQSIHFFLTKRTNNVDHHKGQISLPGGARETGETIQETALRETWEELGIDLGSDAIIGNLTPFNIPVSKFQIHPFIGWSNSLSEIHPDPQEVEKVFIPPLSSLLDDSNFFTETRHYNGTNYQAPYYVFPEGKVWGATAIILTELKQIISG